MKTVEDAVNHFDGAWPYPLAQKLYTIKGKYTNGIDWSSWANENYIFMEMSNGCFVCTREQFEDEAERLGYRGELNPATSSVTDSQAQEFAEEFGTCSDGGKCGYGGVCDDCPNRNTVDDPVNHPTHYTSGEIECIDAIRAALTPEEFRGFCKGNVIKYSWREKIKGGDQDLKKAVWYASKAVESTNG